MSCKRTLELVKKHLDKVLRLIEEDDEKAGKGRLSWRGRGRRTVKGGRIWRNWLLRRCRIAALGAGEVGGFERNDEKLVVYGKSEPLDNAIVPSLELA